MIRYLTHLRGIAASCTQSLRAMCADIPEAPFSLELSVHPPYTQNLSTLNATPTPLSTFMQTNPGLSYTTFIASPSEHCFSVRQFSYHIKRLTEGANILQHHQHTHDPDLVHTCLQHVLALLYRARIHEEGTGSHLQLVPILTPSGTLHIHVSKFVPDTTDARIHVLLAGSPRTQACVKNTSWYTHRTPLKRSAFVTQETILLTPPDTSPALVEGLVTNAFVLYKSGVLYTAPRACVLEGSVRRDVLTVCERLGIEVRETCAELKEWEMYDAVFVTNVRRGVQKVGALCVRDVDVCERVGCPRFIELPWVGERVVDAIANGVRELAECG